MPFTFLSHQAVVLPLKIARPTWFVGTALVFGSMAPDVEYFIRGEPQATIGHTLAGQLTFCLPVTLLLVLLFRAVIAGPLGAQVPAARLQSIAFVPRTGRYWLLAIPSALVGSGSHVLWDGFTHANGFVAERWALLREPVFSIGAHTVRVYKLLQHGSTVLGACTTLALLAWIVRRMPVGPEERPTGVSRLALLAPTLLGVLVGAAVGISHGGAFLDVAVRAFLRGTSFAFLGLCVGCAFTRPTATG